jgi:uncharacterized membrane protein
MPEHLTWFKWESYATWLSGAALLILVYWVGGEALSDRPGKSGPCAMAGRLDLRSFR